MMRSILFSVLFLVLGLGSLGPRLSYAQDKKPTQVVLPAVRSVTITQATFKTPCPVENICFEIAWEASSLFTPTILATKIKGFEVTVKATASDLSPPNDVKKITVNAGARKANAQFFSGFISRLEVTVKVLETNGVSATKTFTFQ